MLDAIGRLPQTHATGLVLMAGLICALCGTIALRVLLATQSGRCTWSFRQIADAAFEGLVTEAAGRIIDANVTFGRLLGCSPEALAGRSLTTVFSPETISRLSGWDGQREPCLVEGELIGAGGVRRPVELSRRTIAGRKQVRVVLAVRDLSERQAAQRRIELLAHRDPLTGLANRLLFRDRLGHCLAAAARSGNGVALLCINLDRFKTVNDLLGQPAGDQVIIEASARLARSVRQIDTVARLGADEFAIIEPIGADAQAAVPLAERVLAELGKPYDLRGQSMTVSASIGIAVAPADAAASEPLIQDAGLALARAKQDGGGSYRFFQPGMDLKLRQRRLLESDLRDAIACGEMDLHYQPLFEAQGLDPVGYEALLRWKHPVRGYVSPAEFIPIAEESGLIGRLGEWALDTACAEAASWTTPLRIAVNLSPVQFAQADLVGMVAATLARHRLSPSRLELEITEGVLIDNTDRALRVVRELKQLGVQIALDDFGTGYSSLGYLRRFPFDRLKIDKSFIGELGTHKNADAIVSSIIAMARNLELQVTAEGVELESQLGHLRAHGCSHVQGFLLGRPVPATELRQADAGRRAKPHHGDARTIPARLVA